MKRVVLLVLLALGAVAHADNPVAQLRLGERGQPHAGVPFTLQVVVDGFDEQPQPDQPRLDLPNAKVTALGATPSVSRSIQIINGKRSDFTRVQWTLQWRVEIAKEGRVHIPAVTVVQGSKRATADGGDIDVDAVPTTDDMKVELTLPQRPVFVGETFEAQLTWLFRRQPEDQSFSVPMMSLDDFTVSAPAAADPRHAIAIQAGAKQLQLPYAVDKVDVGGVKYDRVTLRFFAAPRKSGKVEVPASSVVAALAVGRADFFGNAPTRLFRATDLAHTLEVKPLPQTDRPPGFAGAVGTQFSMSVGTSRSVVQLGEPVELAITVKSSERLDTLALPRLDGEGMLPRDRFTVPADAPTGELADDGKSKTFKVTVNVIGPATEIPALAFSYFDPVKGQYQTIHSDPIALSVKGGSVVGAGDVVAATPQKKPTGGAQPSDAELALVGADLALSARGQVDDRPLGGVMLWLLVALLYLVPIGLLMLRTYQVRTRGQREEAAEVRAARRRVEDELARAAKDPARETAGALAAALRGFARAVDRDPGDDGGLLARIETESFSPGASAAPLSSDVRERAADLVRRWTADARRRPAKGKAAAAGVAAALLVVLATPAHAVAAQPELARASADALEEGRAAYQQAMTLSDASARKTAFARAEAALGEAAHGADTPELVTDWGNAALGASDVATATLAFRRALALDPSNVRARRNLAWLRSRQADNLRPAETSTADTLFFFHSWPRQHRLLVGAAAFAIAMLMLVPWSGRRRRALSRLSVIPLAVWLAMVVSVLFEDRHADDAVVMDSVVLRAADSAGAPAALTQPLPRGAEVTVLERRDGWTKVRLANGTAGWLPAGAVEPI